MSKINFTGTLSLPVQIKKDLQLKIRNGQVKSEEKLPSENNLAKNYGVSRMTARQAILELINEGVLLRIPGRGTFVASKAIAKDNHYELSNSLFSLVVPSLHSSFFREIVYGAEKMAKSHGYEITLRFSNEDPLEEKRYLQKLLKVETKGLIFTAGRYSHSNLGLLQEIRRKIPLVVVDVAIPGLEADLVVSDDRNGGFLATTHLIELGHKNILHLAGSQGDSSAENRLAGYREALKKFRIEYQPKLVRFTGWHFEEGYYETKKFFISNHNEEKITAIFACNDEVAAGAFRALAKLGIKVPDEVALIGYGNLDMGRFLEVPLTTINQSSEEMGGAAVKLLLDKVSGHRRLDERKEVILPTKLTVRQSCGIHQALQVQPVNSVGNIQVA